MANPLRCEAEFTAGEDTYKVRFDWNAAAEFEDKAARPLSDALLEIGHEKLCAKSLRAMLWAGLRAHHEDVSLEGAGRLLDVIGRREAQRLMGVALRYYFPELERKKGAGKAGGNPPAPAAGA